MAIHDTFEPLVSQLSKGARAAYPFLRSAAAGADSASKIYEDMRAAGFPLRKQTTLDLVALLRNKADTDRFIRTFGLNAIIPDSLHEVTPTKIGGGNNHQYLVGLNSTNPLIPEKIFVNADRPLSANEVFGKAASAFGGQSDENMNPDTLGSVFMTIDDARWIPGEPF